MKQLICTFMLTTMVLTWGMAQEIGIKEVRNNYEYTLNGAPLKLKDMARIMKGDPDAMAKVNSARAQKTISLVSAFAGGWVLGGMLGKAISGDYEDALIDEIAIGTGLVGLAFLLQSGAKKETHRAVTNYNSSLANRRQGQTSIELNATSNGVGLVLRF